MQTIIRLCLDTNKKEKFIKSGMWGNGRLAYSKITLNESGEEVIKNEDDGTYYQLRINNKLVMIHI